MPVRVVESRQNARLKELRRALATAGRGEGGRAGSTRGLVGIEGPNLLEEALRAGLRVAQSLWRKGAERLLDAAGRAAGDRRPVAAAEVARARVGHRDAAADCRAGRAAGLVVDARCSTKTRKKRWSSCWPAFRIPETWARLLRSAEAFGATGVVSLPGTVSAWNPKAVRASAGSVFRVPLLAASERECFEQLREAGVLVLATTVRAAQPADLVDMAGPGRPPHRQRGQRSSGRFGGQSRRQNHHSLPRSC